MEAIEVAPVVFFAMISGSWFDSAKLCFLFFLLFLTFAVISSSLDSSSNPDNFSNMVTLCFMSLAIAGALRSAIRTIDRTIFLNFTAKIDFPLMVSDPPLIDSIIRWRRSLLSRLLLFDDGESFIFLTIGFSLLKMILGDKDAIIWLDGDHGSRGDLVACEIFVSAATMHDKTR